MLRLLPALLLLACSGDRPAPVPQPPTTRAADASPRAQLSPSPLERWTGMKGSAWKEVEDLEDQEKYEAAAAKVAEILESARTDEEPEEIVRAIIRTVQLRTALHGYETAVRFLGETSWPKDLLAQATLNLYMAHAFTNYARTYSWEVRQRERVASKEKIDLKQWTWLEIHDAARAAYLAAWKQRATLGEQPVGVLAEYVTPNDYPRRIRGTLRDAVTYLWVEALSDRSTWRPEHAAQVYLLDLERLSKRRVTLPDLADPAVHPLVKVAAILSDLEAWHATGERAEAALEARLERIRRLYDAFTEAADREDLRDSLAKVLEGYRTLQWWSKGQAQLAEMWRDHDAPDARVKARDLAAAGREAFPNSVGGRRCAHLVDALELPTVSIDAAAHDGPDRRSIGVHHMNVAKLHFRAWRYDLLKHVARQKDYRLLPDHRDIDPLLKEKPDAEWSVKLPPTPDLRSHRTWVTPPLNEPGAWVVVASVTSDFSRRENRLDAALVTITDLVLLRRQPVGAVEAHVLSGADGSPRVGAQVHLYRYDWRNGHARVASQRSGKDGSVRFTGRPGQSHFLVAEDGPHIVVDPSYVAFGYQPTHAAQSAALVYTDRSVYRPGQTVHWQVVGYSGRADQGRFSVDAKADLTVELRDGNNQVVATAKVKTGDFGSAAGGFEIPAGRALGQWRLGTTRSVNHGGAVRVEEYKRPTFEAKLLPSEKPYRLNQVAEVKGEARYYFGLPVAGGEVRWRVTRTPVYPWWWSYYYWNANTQEQVVATGRDALDEEGRFTVRFTPTADERLAKGRARAVTYRYAVAVEVTDEGGETREASRAMRLGFVAVEATVEHDGGYLAADAEAELRLRRTDLDGAPAKGAGSWRLLRLDQGAGPVLPADRPLPAADDGSLQTPGDRQRARWDHRYDPVAAIADWADGEEVAKGQVEHGEDGVAKVTLPALGAGAYRVRYTTKDRFGGAYETQRELVVVGSSTPLAVAAQLLTARSDARVGERLEVFAHSGFADQLVYLERWRAGERLWRRAIRGGERLELDIEEADRGGFGLTLTFLRDHQAVQIARSIHVPWDNKELKVSLETFRDTLRPGQKETWKVKVQAKNAAVAAAEVLAYMYDRSLDVFAPHNPPSALSLYPWRGGAPLAQTTLRQAQRIGLHAEGLGRPSPYPDLQADRLKFPSGYGIGGPGGRRYRKSAPAGLMMRSAGMPPPAPSAAPAPPAEAEPLAEADEAPAAQAEAPPPPPDANGEPAAEAPDGEVRSDFSETAFWAPQLRLDADGTAAIEFEVPDSVTSWNVYVHAITKDLAAGSHKAEARTVKELMVRPYLPRFFREGDEARLQVVLNNAGEEVLAGILDFDIVDPEGGQSVLAEFGLDKARASGKPFEIKPLGSAKLAFPVKAPSRVGLVAIVVKGSAGAFADGERRPIPLLPGRVHLAQSRFTTLKDTVTKTLRFEELAANKDKTRIDEQLVVTLDGQLFYGVLAALPYLVNYPYECTEQTLNRFLATGILSSLYADYPAVARMAKKLSRRDTPLERWDDQDPNRKIALEETPWLQQAQGGTATDFEKVLDPRVADAQRRASLEKLRKAQTSLGAWPWFPGGPPSPYVTLYLLHGFSKAIEFGVDVPRDMVRKGWEYLRRHHVDRVVDEALRHDCCWEFVTFLNYVLSSYPDSKWGVEVFDAPYRKKMLDFSFAHWKEHAPYLKGYLALTLARSDRKKDAMLVWESVLDSAKEAEDQGTFWAPEDRSWLWYNDTIESHAFALRTTLELVPKWEKTDGLVLWLFLNKKLNHWKSTKATAEVIYSLAHYLKRTGGLGVREETKVTVGDIERTFVFEPDEFTGKKNQIVVAGKDIVPEKHSSVTFAKEGKGFQLASATWHFSTEEMPDAAHGDFLGVEREFFRRVKEGRETTLVPLAPGAELRVGDEVEVQLSLRSKHALEYVHLRDPRGAGFEPTSQRSQHKWDLGIGWFEEIRDSGTNFFFERLPVGEYTFKYRVRCSVAGTFKVGPATVQPMYAPEFAAYSAGHLLTITPN